jgi:hypothetical protein
MSDLDDFWDGIDLKLETLVKNGFVKLPSLKKFNLNLDNLASNIIVDMNGVAFSELGTSHKSFLETLKIEKNLTPKLFDIANKHMDYKGDLNNQYHIARRVEPGNSKEMYRAHFDSHLFTLVLPIKIPTASNGGTIGDLIYFPNARDAPKSEVGNLFSKAYHKKYASKSGIKTFSNKHQRITDNFTDYEPLLFLGNTTLHTNRQVSSDCSSDRLTLLAHFFDPSPKYGVGAIVRWFRAR